ncbi:MAG: ABC transporter substrate-binding protein [Clostridiales bacterium]|nr:ABC transporter substrate-binding protein [Clostridiales bacterium]MDU3242507.1 ABC transporter substrate-binding protein [Clostridiales bacterium]
MKRKVISVLLCTAMVATMAAGCGSSAKETEAAATAAATDAATEAPAATEAATTEAASASEAAADTTDGGSDEGGNITVGFSQVGAESDWRTANSESMKSTFSKDNGYELIFDDAQQKQENQITAIRNFIQQEVDYIVLAPVTETGWDTVLQEAKDAAIPVIIVDRMVDVSDDSLYTAWVGSNFELEGKKASAWLKAYADAKGMKEINIVDIQGTIGASAQIGRTKGLADAVEANGWNLLAAQTGEFTQAKGQEVMESMLKQYDNINVVYCENDNEAFGAIDAIEAAGKTVGVDGDILVMSFDSTNAGLTDTLSGKIVCNTECNPLHGPRVEEIIQKLEAGESVEKEQYVDEEIFANPSEVTSINVDGTDYPVTVMTQEVLDSRAY